jgi:hypothetical protein
MNITQSILGIAIGSLDLFKWPTGKIGKRLYEIVSDLTTSEFPGDISR